MSEGEGRLRPASADNLEQLLAVFRSSTEALAESKGLYEWGLSRFQGSALCLLALATAARLTPGIRVVHVEQMAFAAMVLFDFDRGRLPPGFRLKRGGQVNASYVESARGQIAAVAHIAMLQMHKSRREAGRFASRRVKYRAFGLASRPTSGQILRWRDGFRTGQGLGGRVFQQIIAVQGLSEGDLDRLLTRSIYFPTGSPFQMESGERTNPDDA